MHFDIKPRYTLKQLFANKQSSTMKISAKAVKSMAISTPPKHAAILPLVPDTEGNELDKKNSVTYELRIDPTDANSTK